MARRRPHVYLDTNVILDVVQDRWAASAKLVSRVEAERWPCSTSRFTVLEMLDALQEDRFMRNLLGQGFILSQIVRRLGGRRSGRFSLRARELDSVYQELREAVEPRLGFITFHEPLSGLWDEAERLCADTNIAPSDAIHLATARGAGCTILVSRDSDFLKIAKPYMPAVATPEKVDRALEELRRAGSNDA